ncbi:MAG: hypothetical protein CV087_21055 [Candidatus Brocadia sp. WS118]|nr:MAG: hypothetical protein CV087_21055 [Candidatus Brocadia sp. WS118]
MNRLSLQIVSCNGARISESISNDSKSEPLYLEYRYLNNIEQNIQISLPKFISHVNYLPNRILDLLEIASYVFCADRYTLRGTINALEYQSWSRSFHFFIKVRDFKFWNTDSVTSKLIETLHFMSGDAQYKFTFLPGHSTPPTSLFDKEEFQVNANEKVNVVLFSGGLDSFAGVIQLLKTSKDQLCLVTHRSQPRSAKTQEQLVNFLNREYPNRIKHYKFLCTLKGKRAKEETQRTRSFLYTSIAYALSHVYSQKRFFVFENGVTSLNFPKREDLFNARASRTTHPKTLGLAEELFSAIEEKAVTIEVPFLWKTKTEIFQLIADFGLKEVIPSTVSCSKTFQNIGDATHCGGCSQCIDRRFAAYASELEDYDESGIYNINFIQNAIEDSTIKTALIDYIRQASDLASWNADYFHDERVNELSDIVDYIPGNDLINKVESIWELCHRHGSQILKAIKRIMQIHDNLLIKFPETSLINLIHDRVYLKPPVESLVKSICSRLDVGIPIAFQRVKPKNENDFNDKVSALINSEKDKYEREHPSIPFALARAIPDHSKYNGGLLIESKYIRDSTTPSKVTEGIAADLTKYPNESYILFVVYDPNRAIVEDDIFKRDIENKRKNRCKIHIIR